MSKAKKILLADNKKSFRESCAEFLELHGYQTIGVASPEECLRVVEDDPPHLTILDVRLRSDEEEDDQSGLELARRLPMRLPKIILTAFPTWEAARAMLQPSEEGLPPASFFVSKLEGLDVLRRAVEQAFTQFVLLKWDLQIEWGEQPPASLIRLIEPMPAEALPEKRGEELEDLLCRLFLNADRVEFDRVLWRQPGLLALQMMVSSGGNAPEPLLVVCGQREAVLAEDDFYRRQIQQTRQVNLPLLPGEKAETVHYAGNCYTLGGIRHAKANSLLELYQVGLKQDSAGLLIDTKNQRAWVDGRLLKLTAREFRLLKFLYERADQLCTRQDLIKQFFGHKKYDEFDDSQKALINTNISRLRIELEADPQNPRYLQTVRGIGYCLKLAE